MSTKSIQQQIFDLYDSIKELEGALAEKQGQIKALSKQNVFQHFEIEKLKTRASVHAELIDDLEVTMQPE